MRRCCRAEGRLREPVRAGHAERFYSLIQSARLARVEPRSHLSEAARWALGKPGIVTLPRHLK